MYPGLPPISKVESFYLFLLSTLFSLGKNIIIKSFSHIKIVADNQHNQVIVKLCLFILSSKLSNIINDTFFFLKVLFKCFQKSNIRDVIFAYTTRAILKSYKPLSIVVQLSILHVCRGSGNDFANRAK